MYDGQISMYNVTGQNCGCPAIILVGRTSCPANHQMPGILNKIISRVYVGSIFKYT